MSNRLADLIVASPLCDEYKLAYLRWDARWREYLRAKGDPADAGAPLLRTLYSLGAYIPRDHPAAVAFRDGVGRAARAHVDLIWTVMYGRFLASDARRRAAGVLLPEEAAGEGIARRKAEPRVPWPSETMPRHDGESMCQWYARRMEADTDLFDVMHPVHRLSEEDARIERACIDIVDTELRALVGCLLDRGLLDDADFLAQAREAVAALGAPLGHAPISGMSWTDQAHMLLSIIWQTRRRDLAMARYEASVADAEGGPGS